MNSSLRSDMDSSTSTSTTHTHFFKYIEENYGLHTMKLFKEISNINYQLASSSSKRRFLLRCRSNDLIPTHIANTCKRHQNIIFASKHGSNRFRDFDQYFARKILKIEIRDIHYHIQFLFRSLSKLQDKIISLNIIDKDTIVQFFHSSSKKFYSLLQKQNLFHKKKFQWLSKKNRKIDTVNSDKTWVKNLTSVDIPPDVLDIVSLGAGHSIPSKFNQTDALLTIKNIECAIQKSTLNGDNKKEIRDRVTKHMTRSLNKQEHITVEMRQMSKKIKSTKLFLKNNPNIFFTSSDKGNVTVCMNKSEYREKMLHLLSDKKTYIQIKKNPLKKLQNNTATILKDLNNNNLLKFSYHNNQLTLTDTVLAKGYGLPKIHKPDVPLRPIISLINSPTHFLAKVIYDELKLAIDTPKSRINNSFELIEKLKSIKLDRDQSLLSLDVTSLFTNISCDLVLKSLERRKDKIRIKCRIPYEDIIEYTKFLFENTYFTFDGNIYQQIFGTPMGSPISPLFADMVMDDLETDCLNELAKNHDCVPILYVRYVDDTCMCVNREKLDLVLNKFNVWDENLKFTSEIESNNRINFLDVTLIRRNEDIIPDWYQKSIASGRLINYTSNHTIQQKRNIIYNLTDRAILLSHSKFHSKNCDKVEKILINNGYPMDFIKRNMNFRKNKIRYKDSTKETVPTSEISEDYKNTVALPFKTNYHLLSSIVRNYNFKIVPIVEKTLSSFIKLGKDITQKWDRTNVVYQISCSNCPITYVGETKRALKIRINEHRIHKNPNSIVSLHEIDDKHSFNWEETKILDSERNYRKRLILEMIYIKMDNNAFNIKDDSFGLSNVYFPLLRNFKIK